MKRILLCGFYACGNLGDDAIANTLVSFLSPRAHLTLLTGDDFSALPALSGSNVLFGSTEHTAEGKTPPPKTRNRFSPALLPIIQRSDILLLGGGSLLQNKTGTPSLLYYLSLIRAARILKKKTALLASGLGPIDGDFARLITRRVLSGMDYSSFRDADACRFARELGVSSPRLSADPALFLPSDETAADRVLKETGVTSPFFLVALRKQTGVAPHTVVYTIMRFAKETRMLPVFVNLFPSEDLSYTQSVASRIAAYTPVAVLPALSPAALLAVTRRASFSLSMRYHLILFSIATSTPFLPVGEDPKLVAAAKILQSPPVFSTAAGDYLFLRMKETLQNAPSLRSLCRINADRMRTLFRSDLDAFSRSLL